MSGMRRSTIATSARRVCSWAIASRPPEHAITSYPAARANRLTTSRIPCSSSTTTSDAALAGHAYSLAYRANRRPDGAAVEKAERARRAPALARTVRVTVVCRHRHENQRHAPGARTQRAPAAGRSAAMTPRSTNAAWSAPSRQIASASPLDAAVTTSQPQPISAAAT